MDNNCYIRLKSKPLRNVGLVFLFCLTFSNALAFTLDSIISSPSTFKPVCISVTPLSGTFSTNTPITFSTFYYAPKTWEEISAAYVKISLSLYPTKYPTKEFLAYYDQNTNKLYLRNDTGTTWLGGYAPGSDNIIENSYARIYCSQTLIKPAKTFLTIQWSIVFNDAFSGPETKSICLKVVTDHSYSHGWVRKGSWIIQGPTMQPDTVPPIGSLVINNGAAHTSSPSVTLSLTAQDNLKGSGLSQMQFSNDNITWSTAEACATSKTWILSQGEGEKAVYVKFSDKAGNWSGIYSDTIIFSTLVTTNITYSYDDLNRLKQAVVGKASATYTYDEIGNIKRQAAEENAP